MPSGYTAGILEGKINSFPEFAKLCSRAFGATMHLRDESLSSEYVPATPSDYHNNELKKAKHRLKEIGLLSNEGIVKNTVASLLKDKDYHSTAIINKKADYQKLNDLLLEAEKWIPPTEEHVGIKEFMITQLKETISFDCGFDYHQKQIEKIVAKLENLSATELREQMVADCEKDIKYHTEHLAKDIKRCEDANKWVTDLLDSLINLKTN